MTTNKHHTIRLIEQNDNAGIAAIIREVSAEHGLTADKGYTVADPTLDTLFEVYDHARSRYWVIEIDGKIVGGGGLSQVAGGDHETAELQKMYLSSAIRGKGAAKEIALMALEFAKKQGYTRCYLETTAELHTAIKLYEALGFEFIDEQIGNTGHTDCEVRMLKAL